MQIACNFLCKQMRRKTVRLPLESLELVEIVASALLQTEFSSSVLWHNVHCKIYTASVILLILVSGKSVAGAQKMQTEYTMALFQSIISALQLILKKRIA